jgi:hypothetical protein
MPARTFADLVSGFCYSAQMMLASAINSCRVLGLLVFMVVASIRYSHQQFALE